jgi:hypothetical protein
MILPHDANPHRMEFSEGTGFDAGASHPDGRLPRTQRRRGIRPWMLVCSIPTAAHGPDARMHRNAKAGVRRQLDQARDSI